MPRLTSLVVAALSSAVFAAEIRGPFPILSVPYHDDGSLDLDVLVKEAQFVADAGVEGFIWCQSNDAIDLLTQEEKMASFAENGCTSPISDLVSAMSALPSAKTNLCTERISSPSARFSSCVNSAMLILLLGLSHFPGYFTSETTS